MPLSARFVLPTVLTVFACLCNAVTYITPNGVTCDTEHPGIAFPVANSTVYLTTSGQKVYFNMTFCGTQYSIFTSNSDGAMFTLDDSQDLKPGQFAYVMDRNVPQSYNQSAIYPESYYEETVGVQMAESSAAPKEGEMHYIKAYEFLSGKSGQAMQVFTIPAVFTYKMPPAINSTSAGSAAPTAYRKRDHIRH